MKRRGELNEAIEKTLGIIIKNAPNFGNSKMKEIQELSTKIDTSEKILGILNLFQSVIPMKINTSPASTSKSYSRDDYYNRFLSSQAELARQKKQTSELLASLEIEMERSNILQDALNKQKVINLDNQKQSQVRETNKAENFNDIQILDLKTKMTQLTKMVQNLSSKQVNNEEINVEINHLKFRNEKLKSTLNRLSSDNEKLSLLYDQQQKQKNSIEKDLAKIKKALQSKTNECEHLSKELEKIRSEQYEIESKPPIEIKNEIAEKQVESLQRTVNDLNTSNEYLGKLCQSLRTQLNNKTIEIESLRKELNARELEITDKTDIISKQADVLSKCGIKDDYSDDTDFDMCAQCTVCGSISKNTYEKLQKHISDLEQKLRTSDQEVNRSKLEIEKLNYDIKDLEKARKDLNEIIRQLSDTLRGDPKFFGRPKAVSIHSLFPPRNSSKTDDEGKKSQTIHSGTWEWRECVRLETELLKMADRLSAAEKEIEEVDRETLSLKRIGFLLADAIGQNFNPHAVESEVLRLIKIAGMHFEMITKTVRVPLEPVD